MWSGDEVEPEKGNLSLGSPEYKSINRFWFLQYLELLNYIA